MLQDNQIRMDTTLIWTSFSQSMHRYLMRQVGNRHDADDLLQDIFLKIHLKLPTLNAEQSLSAWVWQITRNTLLDHYKKRRLPSTELSQAEWIAQETAPDNFNQSLAMCVRMLIDLLPQAQQEALLLADLDHISQKELAERWGVSYSGAKSRVQRARTDLHGIFLHCCAIQADCYGNIMSVDCLEKTC